MFYDFSQQTAVVVEVFYNCQVMEFKLLKPLQKQHNIPYPVTFSRLWQPSLSRGFQSHLCVDCHNAIENEASSSSLVESIPLYL